MLCPLRNKLHEEIANRYTPYVFNTIILPNINTNIINREVLSADEKERLFNTFDSIVSNNELVIDSLVESGFFSKYKKIVGYDNYKETVKMLKDKNDIKYTYDVMDRILLLYKLKSFKGKMNLLDGLSIKTNVESIKSFVLENKITNEGIGVFSVLYDYGLLDEGAELVDEFIKDTRLQDIVYHDIMNRTLPLDFKMKVAVEPFFEKHGVKIEVLDDETFFEQLQKVLANSTYPYIVGDAQYIASKNAFFLKDASTNTVKIVIRESKFNEDILSHELGHLIVDFIYNEDRYFYDELKEFFSKNYSEQYKELFNKNKAIYGDNDLFAELETIQELLDRFISNMIDEQGNIVIGVRYLNIFDKIFYYLKKIVLMVLGYYYNERYDTDILAETLDTRLFLHKRLKEIVNKLNEIGYISPISNISGSYILFNSGNTESAKGLASIAKTLVKWYNETLKQLVNEIIKNRDVKEEVVIEVIKEGIVDLYKTEVSDRIFSFAAVSQQNRLLINYLEKDDIKKVYEDIFKSAIMRDYKKDFNIYFGEVFTTVALKKFKDISPANFEFGDYQVIKFYGGKAEIGSEDVKKVGYFRLLLAFTVIRKYKEKLEKLNNDIDITDEDDTMSKNHDTKLKSALNTAIEILEKYEKEYLNVLEQVVRSSKIPITSIPGVNPKNIDKPIFTKDKTIEFIYHIFAKTLIVKDNKMSEVDFINFLGRNDIFSNDAFDSFLEKIDKAIDNTLLSSMDVLTFEDKGTIKMQKFGLNTMNILFVLSTALNFTKAIVSYGSGVESVVYNNKVYNILDIYNPVSFNVVFDFKDNQIHKNILNYILSIDVNLHAGNQRQKQLSSYRSITKVIDFDQFYNSLYGHDTRESLTFLPLLVRLAFSMNDKEMMYEIVNPVDSFVNTQLVISLLNVLNSTNVGGEFSKLFKDDSKTGVASELNGFLLSTIFESYFAWNKGQISKENITYDIDKDSIFLLALDMTLGFLERLRNEKRNTVKVEGIVLVFLNFLSNIKNIKNVKHLNELEKEFNTKFANLTYNKSIDERSVYFKMFDIKLEENIEIPLTSDLSELLKSVIDKIDSKSLQNAINSQELESLIYKTKILDLNKIKLFIEILNDKNIGYKYLEDDRIFFKLQGVATYNKISSTLLLNLIYKKVINEIFKSTRQTLINYLNDKQAYVYRSPLAQHYPLLWNIIVDCIRNNALVLNSSKVVENGVKGFRYSAKGKANTHTLVDKVSYKMLEEYSIEELLNVGLDKANETIENYRKRQIKGFGQRDVLLNLVLDSIPIKVKEGNTDVIGASKYGLDKTITYNVYSEELKEVELNLAYLYHTYSDLNRTIFTLNERFNKTLHDRFKNLIKKDEVLKQITQENKRLNIADVLEIVERIKEINNTQNQLGDEINKIFKALVENTISYYEYMRVMDKINDDFYAKQINLLRSIFSSNNLLFNFIYLINQLSTIEVSSNLFKSQLEMVDLINPNQQLTLDDYNPYDTIFGLSISDDFRLLLEDLYPGDTFYNEFYDTVNKYFSTKLFKKVLDFKVITDVFNFDNIGFLKDNIVAGKVNKELYTKWLSEKLNGIKIKGSSNFVLSAEKNILKMLTNTSYSKFKNKNDKIVSIKSEYDKDNKAIGKGVFRIVVDKFYITYQDKLDIVLETINKKINELYDSKELTDNEKRLIEKFKTTNNDKLLELLLFDSKYFYNLLLSISSKKGVSATHIDTILKYSSLIGSLFNSYIKKQDVIKSIINDHNFKNTINKYNYYTRSKLYEDIYRVEKSVIQTNTANEEDLLKAFNQIIEAYLVYPKFTYGTFLGVVNNLQNKKTNSGTHIDILYKSLFGLENLKYYNVESFIKNSDFEILVESIFSHNDFENLKNNLLDQIPSDYNIYIDGGNSLFGNVFDIGLLNDSAREGESLRHQNYNLYDKMISQFSNLYLKDEFLYTIPEAKNYYQSSYVTGQTLYKDNIWSLNFTNNYEIINNITDIIERKKEIIKNYLKLFSPSIINVEDSIRSFFDKINEKASTHKFGYEFPVISKTDDILHNTLHQLFNLTTRDLSNQDNFYNIFDKLQNSDGIFQNVRNLLNYKNIDSTYDALLMLRSYPSVLKKLVEIFEFLNNIGDISLLDAYSIKDEAKIVYSNLRNGALPNNSDLDLLSGEDSIFMLGLFKKLGILNVNDADNLITELRKTFLEHKQHKNADWQYFFVDFFDKNKKTVFNQQDFDANSSKLLVDDIKNILRIPKLTLDQYALLLILVDLDSIVIFNDKIKEKIVKEILGSNVSNPVVAYEKVKNIFEKLNVKVNPNRVTFSTLLSDSQESKKCQYVLTFYEILNYLHNAALNLDSDNRLYSLSSLLSTVVRDIRVKEEADIGGKKQESKFIISIFNKVHIFSSNKKVENIGDKVKEIFNTSLAYNYKLIEIEEYIKTVANFLIGIYFDVGVIYSKKRDSDIDLEVKNTILNAYTDVLNHIYESTIKKSMEKVYDLIALSDVLFSDDSPIKVAPLNFNDFDVNVFKEYGKWKWGDDTFVNNLNAMTVNNDDSSAEMVKPHLNSILNLFYEVYNGFRKMFKNWQKTNKDEKLINIFAKTEPYDINKDVKFFNKMNAYIMKGFEKVAINVQHILHRFSKEYENTLQYNNPINILKAFEAKGNTYAEYLLGLAKKYIDYLNLRPSHRLTAFNNLIIAIFTAFLYIKISFALGSMLLSVIVVHIASVVVRSFADTMDSKGAIDFLKNFAYRFIYIIMNDVKAIFKFIKDIMPFNGAKISRFIKSFESLFLPVSTEITSQISSAIEGSKSGILEESNKISDEATKSKQSFTQRIKNVGFRSVLNNILALTGAIILKPVYSIMSNMLEIKNRLEENLHQHIYYQIMLKYQLFGHYIKDIFILNEKDGNITLNEKGLGILIDIIKNNESESTQAELILKEFIINFEGVTSKTTVNDLKGKLKSIPFTRFVSLSPMNDIITNSVLSQLYYTFYSAYIGSEFLDIKLTQLSGMFRFLFLMLTTIIHLAVGLFKISKYLIFIPIYGIINYFIDDYRLLEKIVNAIVGTDTFKRLDETIKQKLEPALHDLSDRIYNIKYQPVLDFINDLFTVTSDSIRYEGAYYGITSFIRQLGGYVFHPLFYMSVIPLVYIISKTMRDKSLSWFERQIYMSRKRLLVSSFTFILIALLSFNIVYTFSSYEMYPFDTKITVGLLNPKHTPEKTELVSEDLGIVFNRPGTNADKGLKMTYRILRFLDTVRINPKTYEKENFLGSNLQGVILNIQSTQQTAENLQNIYVEQNKVFSEKSLKTMKVLRNETRSFNQLNYVLSTNKLMSQEMIHLIITTNLKLGLEALVKDFSIFDGCKAIYDKEGIELNEKMLRMGNFIYEKIGDAIDPRFKEVVVREDLFPLVYTTIASRQMVGEIDITKFDLIVKNYMNTRLNQLDEDYISVSFIMEAFNKLRSINVNQTNLNTDAPTIIFDFLKKHSGDASFIPENVFIEKMKTDPKFRQAVLNGLGYIFDRNFSALINVLFNIKLPPQAYGAYFLPVTTNKEEAYTVEDLHKAIPLFSDEYITQHISHKTAETAIRVVADELKIKDEKKKDLLLRKLQSESKYFVVRPSLFYSFIKNFKNELRNPLHFNFYKAMDNIDRWFYETYTPKKEEPKNENE
jgi:hypothetical protein